MSDRKIAIIGIVLASVSVLGLIILSILLLVGEFDKVQNILEFDQLKNGGCSAIVIQSAEVFLPDIKTFSVNALVSGWFDYSDGYGQILIQGNISLNGIEETKLRWDIILPPGIAVYAKPVPVSMPGEAYLGVLSYINLDFTNDFCASVRSRTIGAAEIRLDANIQPSEENSDTLVYSILCPIIANTLA
jgi:hypothetical protein